MRKIRISIVCLMVSVLGGILPISGVRAQSAEEALNFLNVEKFQTSISTIKQAIDKDPQNAANYFYAGYIYLNLDQPDSARPYFNKGVSIDDKEPLNYVGLGHLVLNEGKPQVALGLFDKAIDLSKGKNQNVYNRIAEALIYADTKDPNKAISYLQKALSLKKDKDKAKAAKFDIDSHIIMGDAYLALKDGGNAISSYERAIAIDNKLAKAYAKVGRIYLIPRNYEAAGAEFQKALDANPNYAPIYKDLGEWYFTYKKDINKAKEMYTKYMQLSDVQKSRTEIAKLTYLMRDYPAAVNELRQALQTEPNNIVLHRLLGYSLNEVGDSIGAKESMDKYFSIVKPDKTIALDYLKYGQILSKLGQDSLAVQNFNTAIEKDTSSINTIAETAEELRKDKKFVPAAALYDILLSRKKDLSANDYLYAGITYLYAKRFDKAETIFQKVIELQPDHYAGYSYLALTKFQQDPEVKNGTAKPHYEKVVQIIEADTAEMDKTKTSALMTAYKYLASYYGSVEDLESAKVQWDKVKKINPADPGVEAFYNYLKEIEEYKKKVEKAKAQQSKKK